MAMATAEQQGSDSADDPAVQAVELCLDGLTKPRVTRQELAADLGTSASAVDAGEVLRQVATGRLRDRCVLEFMVSGASLEEPKRHILHTVAASELASTLAGLRPGAEAEVSAVRLRSLKAG